MGSRTLKDATHAEFLTISQAAELVQVSAWQVRQWIRLGRLRRFGEGRLWRVRREDVLRALVAAAPKPVGDAGARALAILEKGGAA